jgi:CheY-like chemotaxis protein
MHDATEYGARPVVLIVEDEALLRMHAAALIEAAGFDPVEASNADDAIAILEARRDIRIVFTDIEMPGSMDGLKLSRAIRDRWPPIEITLTSGKRHPPADDLPARGQFFPKPYNPAALIAAITNFANS